MINREKFYTTIRPKFGKLTQSQVDGMNAILATWDKSVFGDLRWLAYMFGTAYRETAFTMQPIKEFGGYEYFERNYGPNGRRPETARRMGNTNTGDGAKYCGRGFVQLTWKINYHNAGLLIGVDLVANPDLAMDCENAAKIMFAGMTEASIIFEDFTDTTGFSFTGKTLEDYFNGSTEDWINARRIINGTDHAYMIAEDAKDFHSALEYV